MHTYSMLCLHVHTPIVLPHMHSPVMKFLLVTVTLVLLLEGGWATNIFDDAKGDINSILVCGRGQPPLIAINPDDFSPTQST